MTNSLPQQPEQHGTLGWSWALIQVASVGFGYLAVPLLLGVLVAVTGLTDLSLEQASLLTAISLPLAIGGGVLVAWLWLRGSGSFAEVLGTIRIESWPRTVGMALVATAGTLVIFAVGGWLAEAAGVDQPEVGLVVDMVTASPWLFVLWIVAVAWIGAGFGEEVLFRGFLMDRLARLPGPLGGMPFALVAQAAVFGLAHTYQGLSGILITGVVGLLLGWVRIRMEGAIWAAVFAHAAVDTIMLSLAYAGELGWYSG